MDRGRIGDFKTRGRARGWALPGAGVTPGEDPQGALEALFALRPEVWLRRVPGRETFAVRNQPAAWGLAAAVVKRFTVDNRRDRWFERLRRIDPRSPARREAENLADLAAEGFPVPQPLAWFEEPGSVGRSALAMERVEHEETLTECLGRCGPAQRRVWLARAAALVGRLHAAGWYHRDLYCEHLILPTRAAGKGLLILDLGRARRQSRPRLRWFVKDLAALQHSAPASLGARARLRFLLNYLAARGLRGPDFSRRERRHLAQAVLRKAARIASHTPRYTDPPSARSTDRRQ